MYGISSTGATGDEMETYGLYRPYILLSTSWIELSLPSSSLENAAHLCGAIYVRFRVCPEDRL
jgi:hypothetical protein